MLDGHVAVSPMEPLNTSQIIGAEYPQDRRSGIKVSGSAFVLIGLEHTGFAEQGLDTAGVTTYGIDATRRFRLEWRA